MAAARAMVFLTAALQRRAALAQRAGGGRPSAAGHAEARRLQAADEGVRKYDCFGEERNWQDAWSKEQKDWCCRQRGRGCAAEAASLLPFDNETTSPPLDTETATPPPVDDSTRPSLDDGMAPPPLGDETVSLPYDCQAGIDFWQKGWSQGKKEWCCEQEQRGCPTTTTTTTTHHCQGDPQSWSESMVKWCCVKQGMGCAAMLTTTTATTATSTGTNLFPVTEGTELAGSEGTELGNGMVEFDCSEGYSYWEELWSVDKKSYCCEHEEKGCRPFDCMLALDRIESEWTDAKKVWCCAKQGLGCAAGAAEYNCTLPAKRWSVERHNWCCVNQGRGCATTTVTETETSSTTTTSTRTSSTSTTTSSRTTSSTTTETTSTSTRSTSSTATSSTSTTTVDPQHSKPFDCDSGYNNWEMGWSTAKMQYCCQHEHRACLPTTTTFTTTSPAPFNCAAGYDNWEMGWSLKKKTWCCKHQQKGCQTILLPFNCSAGAKKWKERWSQQKKLWCCENELRGCQNKTSTTTTTTTTTSTATTTTTTTTTSTTDTVPTTSTYDCNHDVKRWQESWSRRQQAFCCKHANRGCPTTTATATTTATSTTRTTTSTLHFDCMSGYVYSNWQKKWSDEKKAWCCKNEKRGCNVTVVTPVLGAKPAGPIHYDCTAELGQWRRSWSQGKKTWCCLKEGAGCQKVIAQGSANPPPWVGFDCDADRSIWKLAWSAAKRDCCKHGKGCEPPSVETTRVLQAAFARDPRAGRVGSAGARAAVAAALGACCWVGAAVLLVGALRRHGHPRRVADEDLALSPRLFDQGGSDAAEQLMPDAGRDASPVRGNRQGR